MNYFIEDFFGFGIDFFLCDAMGLNIWTHNDIYIPLKIITINLRKFRISLQQSLIQTFSQLLANRVIRNIDTVQMTKNLQILNTFLIRNLIRIQPKLRHSVLLVIQSRYSFNLVISQIQRLQLSQGFQIFNLRNFVLLEVETLKFHICG